MAFLKKAMLWLLAGVYLLFRLAWRLWGLLLLVALAGGLASLYWHEIVANFTEPEPSGFSMRAFPESYEGQYWLQVSGRLAVSHARVRSDASTRARGKVELLVPLVTPDWNVRQPVHAVLIFGPMDEGQAKGWLNGHSAQPDYTATGVVRSSDFQKIFPELKPGSPLVFVHDGTRPMSIGSLLGLTAVLFFIGLVCWGIKKAASRLQPRG